MTTQTIKQDIENAKILAEQLMEAVYKINKSTCQEMGRKENEQESFTEEMLLSEMITPEIKTAGELLQKLNALNNIYNN